MDRRAEVGYETIVAWCPDGFHRRHDHPPLRKQWARRVHGPEPVPGDEFDWDEIGFMMTGALFSHPGPATRSQMAALFSLAPSLEELTGHATGAWGWECVRMWRRRLSS
jgi:hypothetical protein